jgi:hypothetical protein
MGDLKVTNWANLQLVLEVLLQQHNCRISAQLFEKTK